MSLKYSQTARARIARLGTHAISEFLDVIPHARRNTYLLVLPAVQGFRKKTPAEMKERQKRLIQALGHSHDLHHKNHEIEWRAFGVAWLLWLEAKNLEGPQPNSLEELQAFGELGVAGASTWISTLLQQPRSDALDRETLAQLFAFSPFDDSDDVKKLIEGRPTCAELTFKRAMSAVPDRLDALELALAPIRTISSQSNLKIQQLSDDAESKARKVESLEAELNQVSSAFIEFKDALPRIKDEHKASLGELREDFSKNSTKIAEHERVLESLDSLTIKIENSQNCLSEQLVRVFSALQTFEETINKLQEEIRISDVGSNRADQIVASSPVELGLHLTEISSDGEPSTIDSEEQAFHLLERNLSAAGLHPEDASKVSRVVLSSFLAGCLVQFSGSLGYFLAEAVSRSLAAECSLLWDVPMGLCDTREALRLLQRMEINDAPTVAVILNGINNSAFEIYGAPVRRAVHQNRLTSAPNGAKKLFIGVWSEGPAVIPGGRPLLELGPIINSESLIWGNPKPRKFSAGNFIAESIGADSNASSLRESTNSLLESVEQISSIPSTYFRRQAMRRAAIALASLPSYDEANGIEALYTAWLLPWAASTGITKDCFEDSLTKLDFHFSAHSFFARALDRYYSEIER